MKKDIESIPCKLFPLWSSLKTFASCALHSGCKHIDLTPLSSPLLLLRPITPFSPHVSSPYPSVQSPCFFTLSLCSVLVLLQLVNLAQSSCYFTRFIPFSHRVTPPDRSIQSSWNAYPGYLSLTPAHMHTCSCIRSGAWCRLAGVIWRRQNGRPHKGLLISCD